jgi:choline dehydrogenase-like flavoprotein
VQTGPMPFSSDYLRAKGGTTLHWLGTCLRMLPNDFRLRSQYRHGVDWPISYQQLRPYYEEATVFIVPLRLGGGTRRGNHCRPGAWR